MSPQRVRWIGLVLEFPPSDRYEGSRLHIAKHDIAWYEVEQVCLYGAPDVTKTRRDPRSGDQLLDVYGRTGAGRPLRCIPKAMPDIADDAYGVITAMEKEAP